jgi:hypothetical protein
MKGPGVLLLLTGYCRVKDAVSYADPTSFQVETVSWGQIHASLFNGRSDMIFQLRQLVIYSTTWRYFVSISYQALQYLCNIELTSHGDCDKWSQIQL